MDAAARRVCMAAGSDAVADCYGTEKIRAIGVPGSRPFFTIQADGPNDGCLLSQVRLTSPKSGIRYANGWGFPRSTCIRAVLAACSPITIRKITGAGQGAGKLGLPCSSETNARTFPPRGGAARQDVLAAADVDVSADDEVDFEARVVHRRAK